MRTWLRVSLLIGLYSLSLASRADQPLQVLTSVRPLQLIAIAVGGEAIHAEALLEPQFSPHDYQLRPSDRTKLSHADVVFWVGPGLEAFLQTPLQALPARVKVKSLQDGDADPHIWMDPIAAIDIARNMAESFAALRPQRREFFDANAKALAATLTKMDAEHHALLLKKPIRRGLLVTHDQYSRFERRYGFVHRAALTNASDLPPSGKSLLKIEQELTDGQIGCVWRQPQETKLYSRVIDTHKVSIVTLDAMAAQIPADERGIELFYQQVWDLGVGCLLN